MHSNKKNTSTSPEEQEGRKYNFIGEQTSLYFHHHSLKEATAGYSDNDGF